MNRTRTASDATDRPQPAPSAAVARPCRRRLGRPRLLIVGCGDIGARIVARLRDRFRVFGTVAAPESAAAVRRAGATPLLLDLDSRPGKSRVRALAERVIVLVPTAPHAQCDRRARHLLGLLGSRTSARMLYLSTTGVYGDRRGAWTDESTPPAPANERARRRLEAESRLRASHWHAAVLRVPGIYAADRLPLERLRLGIPVAVAADDVITNHIHADDLARACVSALFRAAPSRTYNIVDDSQLFLGDFLNRVADRVGLPRPPRVPSEQLSAAVGPRRMSFLGESRRLRNQRMKRELRLCLHYPNVDAGLADLGTSPPAGHAVLATQFPAQATAAAPGVTPAQHPGA